MNLSKQKFMTIDLKNSLNSTIHAAATLIEKVEKYKYLRTWVNETRESDEIKT